MSLRRNSALLVTLSTITLGCIGAANAVVVPGTSDPWLAGMPNGSTASGGDSAPTESPILVPDLTLSAGEVLTFSVTGSVSHIRAPSGNPPDGSEGGAIPHVGGAQNGIASLTAPFNSLIGVFLSNAQPSLSAAPSSLDFPISGLGFASLSPALQQPFFIGDGLTGTGTGSTQDFVVPTGATRLFLGTMDEFGWFDNSGSFTITVSTTTAPPAPLSSVPEPATAPLLAGVLAGFLVLRVRARLRTLPSST